MSEKVNFNGDVGHVAVGDVIEAPRMSNVVNLNVNEVKKEVQLITEYQRRKINNLVKEWSAICGDKEIDIYKVFIADFGLRRFRELPSEHYRSVKATLEGWIAGSAKVTAAAPAAPVIEHTAVKGQGHLPCMACTEKDAAFARSQRTNFAQCVLIVILAVSCAWLLYQMPAPHDDDQQAENTCYFDGRAYSAGSTVRNVTGNLQECAADATTTQVRWQTTRRGR